MSEMIKYEVDAHGVATLTWDMPGRSMNVMNEDSIAAFEALLTKVAEDDNVIGAVITSGKRVFLAGADLEMMLKTMPKEAEPAMAATSKFQTVLRGLETLGKPFAAAINGTALGGGFELCLACHYRVAADDPKVQIGQPEAKIGLLPGAGGTQRIPRLIGAQAALPLLLEGNGLNVQKAQKLGLIHAVVPADGLLDEARRWVREEGEANKVQPWDKKGFKIPGGVPMSPAGMQMWMAGNAMLRKRTFGNYEAPNAIMSCVYEGLQVPIDTALRIESRYFTQLILGKQSRSMIRTLFFGMQNANKLARRPAEVDKASYTKVGVLGAGMMGAGIAYATAMAGIDCVLLDTDQDLADTGKAYTEGLLAKRVGRGRMDQGKADAVLAKITPTTDFADLAGCELVIEAVFEDRAIKADVTAKTEAVLSADAIFASNTSTLPITGLAEASTRPANFIGLHFFSPVDKMPLVEIIRGAKTSDACLARAMDYVQAIRKTPIVVNDSRGFYTSRVFGTFVSEGLNMLAEGISPALIENASRMAGMPVGALAMADEVSIELINRIRSQTKKDLGDQYRADASDDVVTAMVETHDRIGKKAGKGFYDYPDGSKKRLWPGLAEAFPPAADQPDVEEVKQRLLYIQGVETARCMAENVVTAPEDADVGSILGWGFAPFTGGVMSMVHDIGIAEFVAECDRLAQKYGPRFAPPQNLRDMAAEGRQLYAA